MSDFQPCFDRTMNFEGRVLENVSGDPGGETFWGISRKFNPNWAGWAIIDSLGPNDNTLPALVAQLYKAEYWDKNLIGLFDSQQLSAQVFDAVVNLGGQAIEALQKLVNVTPDGNIGAISLSAINAQTESVIVEAFINWRKSHYQSIVEADPSKQKFLQGWLSRCELA